MAKTKGDVLVVDNDQDSLENCRRILGPHGYNVQTSSSPAEALSMLESAPCDLLVTGIEMDGMDGLELIRKARERVPGVHAVVMTAAPSQESIKAALGLRVLDYLPKPFTPSRLIEVAASIAKAKEAPDDEGYNEEVASRLDELIEKYRRTPGNLIPILREAQSFIYCLPPPVLRHIARGINRPESELHSIVSFFPFFSISPKGKHSIKICIGTACYVKRAEEIVKKLKEELKIDMGEVTQDKLFSIEGVRCLGACGLAPVVVIDQDTYGAVNPAEAVELLANYS